MPANHKATDEQVVAAYNAEGSVWKAAVALGMCGQSVHERLVKLGLSKPINFFSEAEDGVLLEHYEAAANAGKLDDLAKSMGRTKPFIARQAKRLGLTNRKRGKPYLAEATSIAMKAWHAVNEHPRGMLGKKHSDATKEAIAKASQARWDAMTEEEQSALILKQIKAKLKKNGALSTNSRETTSWKAGWREIGGQRRYFRSRWEANYARYLQLLAEEGKIRSWEHEPQTFIFEDILRGSRTYLPDFRIVDVAGNITFHEVKGWMDSRSRTKIARMAKYYPEVALVVVDKDDYGKMNKYYRYTVPGWE